MSFSYTPGVSVLRDIFLRLEAGRTLGLLGRTGSGKTTMSRLLFRFYDPDEGSVRLGETDIRELRLEDLRNRVGLVTQEVQLFQATVRDNLTLFDPAITDDAVVGTLEFTGVGRLVPHPAERARLRDQRGWRPALGRRVAATGLCPGLSSATRTA